MNWTVVTDRDVLRRLARIPEPERGRLVEAIEALEGGPEAGDVRRLAGRSGYRLRVGRWRVLLDIYEDARTIHVTQVGPRGDIYKK
ncbi:type II toxin-antitoxin system RelE/ParE family toxin [uncultured Fretibacterium sp.]|uniref:type II toxin-antitoxin system RelE family toxin n=1 Tax=uncultured Fretibacterium sp. TaxID=1678694 RepID=UPI0026035C5F|nr:type II toxin-antitoxin system RelE/ParE family toxin [uncultured Fretibacterium sp.]